MIASLGILLVSSLIWLTEGPTLFKKNNKKDSMTFSVLLVFGVGLSVAHVLFKPLPNPMDFISFVYKPLSDAVWAWLS